MRAILALLDGIDKYAQDQMLARARRAAPDRDRVPCRARMVDPSAIHPVAEGGMRCRLIQVVDLSPSTARAATAI